MIEMSAETDDWALESRPVTCAVSEPDQWPVGLAAVSAGVADVVFTMHGVSGIQLVLPGTQMVPASLPMVPVHPVSVTSTWLHHRIAAALRLAGDAAGALDEDRTAVAACPPNQPSRLAYWSVGTDLLALGRARDAIAPLAAAVATRGAAAEEGDAQFALAQALWNGPDARARARTRALALEARQKVVAVVSALHGPGFVQRLDRIDAWLAAHP